MIILAWVIVILTIVLLVAFLLVDWIQNGRQSIMGMLAPMILAMIIACIVLWAFITVST